ncbi:MAG: NAD-dependent protein deacylase [Dehalococcoidales bacterium]|nr:NAD-dependent protein deacylase [Dehalococcoidales bacterium]
MDYIEQVADMVVGAKKVVIFTGAGFSTESDIPDFRGPQGVWQQFDPDELNLPNFLRSEEIREKYWQVHKLFWEAVKDAKPNKGHYAVTELYNMGKLDCVITQNTDGLHQKSGTPEEKMLELHGTMHWVDCLDCKKRYPRDYAHQKMLSGEKVPRCGDCNGILKPATVAYGQSMPVRETNEAVEKSSHCDLLLALGSSLIVYPAAQMPLLAKQNGAKLVIVNITPTPHDSYADVVIAEKTGETLDKVVQKAKAKKKA